MKVNKHYAALEDSYLFSTIAHKIAEYSRENPDANIIRMGIGDVAAPLNRVLRTLSMDTVRSRATIFCAMPSRDITPRLGWSCRAMIFLSATVPKAILAIFWICLTRIILC